MTMTISSRCSTCGTEIPEGAGRYITADHVYCCQCGLPFPLGSARVTITIMGLEAREKFKEEGGKHGK